MIADKLVLLALLGLREQGLVVGVRGIKIGVSTGVERPGARIRVSAGIGWGALYVHGGRWKLGELGVC